MLNAAESARAQVVEKHALLQAAHAALLAEHEDLEALAQSAGSLRAAATVAQAERAAALTEVASLRAEVEALQKQVAALSAEVARAMGRPDALTSLTLSELAGLEGQLEAALRSVREATLRRTIEAAAQRVSSEQAACALCLEAPKGTVFNCGHQACSGCASKLDTCPFCRVPITTRIKLFES
jgi:polyhydroxyalkanoate synthesis regulator phasin